MEHVARWHDKLNGKRPEEVLEWAVKTFGDNVAFATSLGLEDQVLVDMIARHALGMRVFTLDTGRLFPETYDLIERVRQRYGMVVHVHFPDAEAIEEMVDEHGINLFRRSRELRKLCCRVRKIEPLKRALRTLDAWVCGLRREQSVTRRDVDVVEWDDANNLVKINPLVDWSEDDVWEYVRSHSVPCNPLHDAGFPSIGCACCTRAIGPGEDARAGRWWWEAPEQKECGLHLKNGKLVRAKENPPD